MADLDSSTRGQLFLIAAITLALSFVALAFLLNSAIYTENLASRGTDTGQLDNDQAADAAVDAAETAIRQTNKNCRKDDDACTAAFRRNYAILTNALENRTLARGGVIEVSRSDTSGNTSEGVRLAQDEYGPFTGSSGSSNWVLLNQTAGYGDEELRGFEMTLGNGTGGSSTRLNVTAFDGGTQSSTMVVIDDSPSTPSSSNDGTLEITVQNSGDTYRCDYKPRENGENVTINFMTGRVGSSQCSALLSIWQDNSGDMDVDSYGIQVKNGNQLENVRWQLLLEDSSLLYSNGGAQFGVSGYPYSDSYGGQPYVGRGIYSVKQNVSFSTQKSQYRATKQVITPNPVPEQ